MTMSIAPEDGVHDLSVEVPGARVTVGRPSPSSVSLDVAGEIDLGTVRALSRCLLAAIDLPECRELLVDLSEVEFLGAAGIGAFAQARARATERAVIVRLVAVSRTARRAFVVTERSDCFDTWPVRGEVRSPTADDDQVHTVSDVQQRGLRAQAVIAQAAGVLAGRTGASPARALAALHGYAERHRFVMTELAGDVVAGRVAPRAVVDASAEYESDVQRQ